MKMNTVHLLEKRINEIATLSTESKTLLFEHIHIKNSVRGELLLSEGQVCHHIYFIEKGCLRTYVNKDGKEINLNFGIENNFVTDLKSLRTGAPSEACIQACEPTSAWVFEKQSLMDLYTQSAEITQFGRNLLEQLLAEQEEHTHLFKLKTPTERYFHIVKHNPALLQKISLTQLASYLGISRETLGRIRRK